MRRALIWLLLSLAAPAAAAQQSEPEAPAASTPQTVPVVQNRLHRLRWELALGAALLPADAFTKQAGVTASLTYHFSDLIAWEAIHLHAYAADPGHVVAWSSSQRRQLEDSIGVAPQRFTVSLYEIDTSFVVSPVYAKLSLLNRHVLYLQMFALGGVGLSMITGGDPADGSLEPGRGLRPAVLVDVGVGLRVWITPRVSVRYDLRQYAAVDTATGTAAWPLYMSLAAAINFDGKPRRAAAAGTEGGARP